MTDRHIDSPANSRVKGWLALEKRRERERTGRFLIEGAREVARAADTVELVEVIHCAAYGVATPPVPATVTVGPRAFDKISHRQHPDGVAAVAVTPRHDLGSFRPQRPALVLVADGIEKPGNVGAMLRTCDAFGASFVGSSLGTDLVNPNVVRSAQGSLFTTPSAAAPREAVVAWAQSRHVLVADPADDALELWDEDLTGETLIVVGSEHAGVDRAWRTVGRSVRIPMHGVADSLNASVAAAVFLAEAVRQRRSGAAG